MTAPTWRARLEKLGRLGLIVHFSIFLLTLVGMAVGIRFGLLDTIPWLAEHLPGDATTLVGAYALTKVLSLPRFALTLSATPVLARWLGRPLPEGTN